MAIKNIKIIYAYHPICKQYSGYLRLLMQRKASFHSFFNRNEIRDFFVMFLHADLLHCSGLFIVLGTCWLWSFMWIWGDLHHRNTTSAAAPEANDLNSETQWLAYGQEFHSNYFQVHANKWYYAQYFRHSTSSKQIVSVLCRTAICF